MVPRAHSRGATHPPFMASSAAWATCLMCFRSTLLVRCWGCLLHAVIIIPPLALALWRIKYLLPTKCSFPHDALTVWPACKVLCCGFWSWFVSILQAPSLLLSTLGEGGGGSLKERRREWVLEYMLRNSRPCWDSAFGLWPSSWRRINRGRFFRMLVCLVPFLTSSQAAAAALTPGCRCKEEEDSGGLKKPCQKPPVILLDINPRYWYTDGPDHFITGFSSLASRTEAHFWNCSSSLTFSWVLRVSLQDPVAKQFCTCCSQRNETQDAVWSLPPFLRSVMLQEVVICNLPPAKKK